MTLLAATLLGWCLLTSSATAQTPFIDTIAGTYVDGFSGDGGPAVSAHLFSPIAVAAGPNDSVLIADLGNHRIRQIDGTATITTIAGGGTGGLGDDGPATDAQLAFPGGVAAGPNNTILIADREHRRIRRVDGTGTITTIAGGGAGGLGDSGPATNAQLEAPSGVAAGPNDTILIADTGNQRIRRIDSAGTITTIAGTGTQGYSGDNGPATNAQLNNPTGVAAGPDNSILVADLGNDRIRRIDSAGTITTIAGTGVRAFSGDHGPAASASLSLPYGVAAGPNSTILIADSGNDRIRRIDGRGTITTIAGTGTKSYSGDNGPATNAALAGPYGVAFGPKHTVLIADGENNRVRRIAAPDRSSCVQTAIRRANGEGFDQSDVTVQTPGGLLEITGVQITNGSITVPDFTTSTTNDVIVTATKEIQGQTTRFSFDATDVYGTTKHCT
ncbi:hypothetical protein [Paraconexibacter sp.]|uniref:hypothetical protein n=1 Tax=Paraconexibacter sp. TaxID=2949640 RepID=UPI0035646EB0